VILLVLRGVPASGKSTHAEELRKQGWTVINRDSIRFSLYGAYWGKSVDENVVTDVENVALDSALRANANAVLDATNLNHKALKTKLSIAARYGAWVHYCDFEVSAYEAVARDAKRERQVGESVIVGFFKRYKIDQRTGVLPAPPDLWPKFEPYVGTPNLPSAFIVDTDGTVANSDGIRNPYDTSRYHLDTLIEHVAAAVVGIEDQGHVIIGLSGRDESFRQVTQNWWIDNGLPFNKFYMREDGDKRVDAVIKYEIFKQHIEPYYDVLGAFDDRPQVIRMWEAIGVPVFNVGKNLEF
jgi:predicted kinase